MTVEARSTLAANADAVWTRAVTPAGINDELTPILKMTIPRGWGGRSIDAVAPGERLGRSWILLGGVLPVDYDDITIAAHGERSFHERSTMATMRVWEHRRSVTPRADGGCEVHDRLTFELRRPLAWVPGAARLSAAIVRALFAHRHRRLRAFHDAR